MKILTRKEEKNLILLFSLARWTLAIAKIVRSKLITRLIENFCYFGEKGRLQIISTYHSNLLMHLDIHSWVERKILTTGYYEKYIDDFLVRALKPGHVAIDVGANTGCHTLVMASSVGMHGKVIAFEPNPRMFERLKANIQLNRFCHVELYPIALSERTGHVTLHIPKIGDFNQGLGTIHSANLDNHCDHIDASIVRLDEWVEQNAITRIDLIKIDVEGHEMQVFKGAYNTLLKFKPTLIFEFSVRQWSNAGVTPIEVEKFLNDLDYELFVMRKNTITSIKSGIKEQGDILALPRNL
jgi:FkbM family methyltransferase